MNEQQYQAEIMDELRQQEESTSMKQISSALVLAQKQFAPALKTNTNPHFKSKYVGLDGCVEAVIDALNDNGIYLMQKNHPNDTGIAVETIFIHESGESMSGGILTVPASKQDPQGYGSALTYARRYSLMAACGIAPEDDDGNAASKQPAKPVFALEMWTKLITDSQNIETLEANYLKAKDAAVKANDSASMKSINALTAKIKAQLLEAK